MPLYGKPQDCSDDSAAGQCARLMHHPLPSRFRRSPNRAQEPQFARPPQGAFPGIHQRPRMRLRGVSSLSSPNNPRRTHERGTTSVPNLAVRDAASSVRFCRDTIGMTSTVTVSPTREVGWPSEIDGTSFAMLEWDDCQLHSPDGCEPLRPHSHAFRNHLLPRLEPNTVRDRIAPEYVVKGHQRNWYAVTEFYNRDPNGYVISSGPTVEREETRMSATGGSSRSPIDAIGTSRGRDMTWEFHRLRQTCKYLPSTRMNIRCIRRGDSSYREVRIGYNDSIARAYAGLAQEASSRRFLPTWVQTQTLVSARPGQPSPSHRITQIEMHSLPQSQPGSTS